MPVYNPALREPPPPCPDNHRPKRPKDCDHCHARHRHLAAVRKDRIANRGHHPKPHHRTEVPLHEQKVSRCRAHVGKGMRRDCPHCKRWRSWLGAVRRYEIATGTYRPVRDAGPVREHLRMLLDPARGGHNHRNVSAESGVSMFTIHRILSGHPVCSADTFDALIGVKPRSVKSRLGRISDQLPNTEAARLFQGLAAQGWTFRHMSEVGGWDTNNTPRSVAHGLRGFVTPETLDRARRVADKLGPYDVNELDRPLPGMDLRCARKAARYGWVPLRDWDGLDIADPTVEPFRPEPLLDQELAAGAGRVLIDNGKVDKVVRGNRPTTALNILECYAVVAAVGDRLGAADLGALLGYPDRKSGQRQVVRMRGALLAANEWLDRTPDDPAAPGCAQAILAATLVLRCTEWPAKLRLTVARGLLRHHRPTRRTHLMQTMLNALVGAQPPPFGRGMSLDALADRFGVTTEEITPLIAAGASLAGNLYRMAPPPRTRRSTGPPAARQESPRSEIDRIAPIPDNEYGRPGSRRRGREART